MSLIQELHRLNEANSIKEEQIIQIVKALVKAGAMGRSGVEWVETNDDNKDVNGPDGKSGWFNDGTLSHAVKSFDPATVRAVVQFFWLIERIQENEIDSDDSKAVIAAVKNL